MRYARRKDAYYSPGVKEAIVNLATEVASVIADASVNTDSLAAALQQSSTHPLAVAVMDKVREELVSVPEVQQAIAPPDRGIEGIVGAQKVRPGSTRLLRELGLDEDALLSDALRLERQGKTVSWLLESSAGELCLLGLLAFGDTVKNTAVTAVSRLHQLGIKTVMLTGDNQGAAQVVAKELGIDEGRGSSG